MLKTPWLLHDCELALWPAWKDGMPFRGPGEGRGRSALLQCKASLTITASSAESAATGHGWTGSEEALPPTYTVAVDFPDGALADAFGRALSRPHHGGFRILTARFLDESSGRWSLLNFFYVTPGGDSSGEQGQVLSRSTTFLSSWMQEWVGDADLPALEPLVLGEVDWVCGSQRIPCLRYNPLTEVWTSLPTNETGDGSRYATLTPLSADAGADVILAMYLPRVTAAPVSGEFLPLAHIVWENTLVLRLGNEASDYHHGLSFPAGHTLQALGIVEPLIAFSQARELDEPLLVFRFLRRVYASLGHGVLAVPTLAGNEAPPVSHDPAFRLALPGPANPGTGQSGLVLLPGGAWLDGTLLT